MTQLDLLDTTHYRLIMKAMLNICNSGKRRGMSVIKTTLFLKNNILVFHTTNNK